MRTSPVTLGSLLGRSYYPIAFVARFPYAMMIVGVLTLVVAARGSLQAGGVNSALVGIGTAVSAPVIGAAADRLGQRPTLLVTGTLNTLAMLALAFVAHSELPLWSVYLLGFFVGATAPQVSPMSRARLVYAVRNRAPQRDRTRLFSRGFSIDSTLDEVSFMFGPVAVGVIAAACDSWVPMLVAAGLTLVFGVLFALHPTTPPALPVSADTAAVAPKRELFRAPLLIIVVGITGLGALFGSTLTALTALLARTGDEASAGIWYGVMGAGSAALALSVMWFSPRFPKRARWLVFGAVTALGTVLMQLGAASQPMIIVALLVTGVGIGPVLVTFYGFAGDRAPQGWSSTVMTMLNSGLVLGQSAAAALTGTVAENVSAEAALWIPVAGGALIFAAGVVNFFLTPAGSELSSDTSN